MAAYSPLGTGSLLQDPAVVSAAASTGLSPARTLLRWGLEQGLAVLPKSVRQEHMREFAPPEQLLGEDAALGAPAAVALAALAAEGPRRYCWDSSGVQ